MNNIIIGMGRTIARHNKDITKIQGEALEFQLWTG